MKNFPARKGFRWMTAAVVLTLVASAMPAAEYIDDDATIQGKEIHAFADGGQNVSVVRGDFRFKVGQRTVSGQDGVVWVQTHTVGDLTRHDITIYVEGKATVTEPGGSRTCDKMMLVTANVQGRLSASGRLTKGPASATPLYQRAQAARQAAAEARQKPQSAAQVATQPAPPLVRVTTCPAVSEGFELTRLATATQPAASRPAPKAATKPAEPPPAKPVSFYADSLTSEVQGDRRATVARGNVYLSQGDADSDLFLELRSQAAVIFSKQAEAQQKDTRSPASPKLTGLSTELGANETAVGVYLEGDVVISRGERYYRGPAAYYDFLTDRALIIEPVFRTIQEQRNIPIYIRAKEARLLSAREVVFTDAKVSSSDFYTPDYHLGAKQVKLTDMTPYDEKGVRLSEPRLQAEMTNATMNVYDTPLLWLPKTKSDFEQGHTPLRRASVGKVGDFGWGVETEWQLFRLLGLTPPEGFKGKYELDWYEKGALSGVELDYARRDFSGYSLFYGALDSEGEDDFGTDRKNIASPDERGRALLRHKQFLPQDWELQFELSYICDRNFLEEYFPDEYYAGKEQETLLYAKKQQNNWAFTSLLKFRLNRWQTQSESAPDLGFYLIGESLLNDTLTFYNESHAGVERFRPANDLDESTSDYFGRFDQRNEIQLPVHAGPLNLVPYAVGRETYWGEERFDDSPKCRPYGQTGLRANTHLWRVYDGAESRLLDVHRLKHIITPEAVTWAASAHGVTPGELYPLNPDIEEHIDSTSGVALGAHQRLQTKRGPAGNQQTVDWMRLSLLLGIFDNGDDPRPTDGRFDWYRPEYSIGRNHLYGDYAWQISDATAFLMDANYDTDNQELARGNAGFAVQRDPRARYYAGLRYIEDLNSSVGTLGLNYQLTEKYSLSVFEQYDFEFDDGENQATSISLIRKFPRWYMGFTFVYSAAEDDVTLLLTLWPEGIPEMRVGSERMSVLGESSKN